MQIKELVDSRTEKVSMNAVAWEELKQEIKLAVFRYSQEKASSAKAEKRLFTKTRKILIAKKAGMFIQEIRDCKGALLEKEYRGAMIRCRTMFLERDKEPCKIFKTKECQHAPRKNITILQVGEAKEDQDSRTAGEALPKISEAVR